MPAIGALSEVDICSMALSHLSISTTIQSIDPPDQTAQAIAAAFWYPKCRNEVLQAAPWNFGSAWALLVSDASTIPGWQYAYQYPNDCLQPIAMSTAAGLRYGAQYYSNWWFPYPLQLYSLPKIPFKVMESQTVAGQLMITCDMPSPMYLFYIQCVTNTAMFDPLFCAALSYKLAERLGGPLRANLEKVTAAKANFMQAKAEALAQHLNAAQQDPERDSPSILAR